MSNENFKTLFLQSNLLLGYFFGHKSQIMKFDLEETCDSWCDSDHFL